MNKCFISGIIGAFCMLFLILGYAAFDSIVSKQRDIEQDREQISFVLDFYRDKLISKCRLFTTENIGLAKAAGIFAGERTIPLMLDYFEKLGSGDSFRRMCILDALILKPDRHYGNFGVLFNTDTMEPISMCPVFDNNRSLFPDLDQEQLDNPD